MRIDRGQMSGEAMNIYALIEESERLCIANAQNANSNSNGSNSNTPSTPSLSSSQLNAALMKIWPENFKYNQCKFCMKIFRECNAYKEHVMEVHTFNEFCNRCLVCPYCKQLLKSNFDKNCDANILLNIHIKKCIALKADLTHVFNSFINTNANSLKLLASVNSMHRASELNDDESDEAEAEADEELADENEYENEQHEDEYEVAQHLYMKSMKVPLASTNDNHKQNNNNNNNSHASAVGSAVANYYNQMYENGKNTTSSSIRFENTTTSLNGAGSASATVRKGKNKLLSDESPPLLQNSNVKNAKNNAKKLKTAFGASDGACYLCDYKNVNRSLVDKHLLDEHVIVKCSICEQDFVSKSLRAHLSETHIPESTETCFECPFDVKRSDECRQHLDLNEFMQHECIADKLSEFKSNKACPICGEVIAISDSELSINNLTQVEKHFQNRHSKVMFNCELCTASFREEGSLIEHIQCEHRPLNADTALKQMKCFKCSQIINYLNESNLIEHVNTECVRGNCGEDNNGFFSADKKINDDDNGMITNSSIFLNPLSILSNVSTTIPHITSIGENRLSTLSNLCADDDALKVEKEEEIISNEVIIETVPLNHEEVVESTCTFAKLPIINIATEQSREATVAAVLNSSNDAEHC